MIMLVILAVIGGLSIVLFSLQREKATMLSDVGKFDLNEYRWEIETFSLDKNVGQVNNKKIAIEKAKSLWNEQSYNFINERRIKVDYDCREESWHIYGTLPRNTLGGVPHAIIRKSGETLAVWVDD